LGTGGDAIRNKGWRRVDLLGKSTPVPAASRKEEMPNKNIWSETKKCAHGAKGGMHKRGEKIF